MRRWPLLLLLVIPTLLLAGVKVRDDTPEPLRTYLQQAIQQGEKDKPEQIDAAKQDIRQAEQRLEEVRRAYRKRKASDADLRRALDDVEAAKAELKRRIDAPALSHRPLPRFDAAGQIGTLPHGLGVSRIVNETSALVFPFVEKRGKSDDKLFQDNPQVDVAIVPTDSPLLLTGIATTDLTDGQRLPGDQTVYQTADIVEIDGTRYRSIERVDIDRHLERR